MNNKQWQERGQGGQLMLYYYNNNRAQMLIKWWRTNKELYYELIPGKLKPKGDRSWVLKALV